MAHEVGQLVQQYVAIRWRLVGRAVGRAVVLELVAGGVRTGGGVLSVPILGEMTLEPEV